MAVFGMQLVLTMVMASVLSKITPHYSLAKWLLCKTGLLYYLHPSDDDLRLATGSKKKSATATRSNSKGNKGGKKEDDNTFTVPKNIDVNLIQTPVTEYDVMNLRFYMEYQWLLDFALCTVVVYVLSELYTFVAPPKDEVNLSMLWCLLVVGFSLKVMFSLTMMYFKGDDNGGEKSMVILSFFIYLLIALGMLIISEEKLDLGLDMAYNSFNSSAAAFLKAQGLNSDGPASKVTFKITMAMVCALIGAFFTFPGLRLGKMHWDAVKFNADKRFLKGIFHVSFIAPIFLVLLWVRPLARRYFTETIFTGYSEPIMTSQMFDIFRLSFVIFVGFIRLILMPYYLQSYLNMANEKIENQKKETGRISNREYQSKIARVFYYLCVVSLQYIAPVILCIFLALMCKTLGGLEWQSLIHPSSAEECSLEEPVMSQHEPIMSIHDVDSISEASKIIATGFDEIKKVFTAEFYRGVLGFCTWWCVFSWFLSGTFGVLYQSYFTTA